MGAARVLVLRAAGTNCDQETAFAFERAGATVDLVHVNRLVETRVALHAYHAFVLPGGFTYGDDVAAGRILANELKHRLGAELLRFVDDGKLILGICNGFQALVKMGLLPGRLPAPRPVRAVPRALAAKAGPEQDEDDLEGEGPEPVVPLPPLPQDVTLTYNDSGRFEDRWVYLKVCSKLSEFIREGDLLQLPVAHGEGKFVPRDESVLRSLQEGDQLVLRYVAPDGSPAGYPCNPNGSVDGVAGICDPTGRIFGLMPHPERHAAVVQHPRWTRLSGPGTGLYPVPSKDGAGLQIFRNGVQWVERHR